MLLVHGIFTHKPSLEIIEVEENSSDDEESYSQYSPEENDPNIDAVVQSFLDVVGKCSEITHKVMSFKVILSFYLEPNNIKIPGRKTFIFT